MSKETWGMTQGEKNKMKYFRNYQRSKFYNEYNKTYKSLHFQLLPEIYDEFDDVCKKMNISKKDLILKAFEVFKNE